MIDSPYVDGRAGGSCGGKGDEEKSLVVPGAEKKDGAPHWEFWVREEHEPQQRRAVQCSG